MYNTSSSVCTLERMMLKLYHHSQIKSSKCLNNHKIKCPTPGEPTLRAPQAQLDRHSSGAIGDTAAAQTISQCAGVQTGRRGTL